MSLSFQALLPALLTPLPHSATVTFDLENTSMASFQEEHTQVLPIPSQALGCQAYFLLLLFWVVPSTSFSVDWLVPFLYEFSELGIWEMTGEGVAMGSN